MRKRDVYIAFCAIFVGAVFATDSWDLLTYEDSLEDNNLEDRANCSKWELSLNFSNTVISTIGPSFISSPLIACLHLKGNDIGEVKRGAFDDVPALEYLNMADNKIDSLMSFGSHENLRILILANQSSDYYRHTRRLDEGTEKYPKLRYLDLSSNRIESVTWTMQNYGYYSYPRRIRMQENLKFPELKYLDLSNNLIQVFSSPAESSLINRNLTHLYLHNNRIYTADLTNFQNLIVLTLHDNNIERLGTDCYSGLCLSDMPKLKYFTISNNQLSSIERGFFKMPELVSLNISNNFLSESLRGIFDELSSLEDLSIDNNKLTSIPIIDSPSKLSSLSLARNQIQFIDSEDFKHTPFLRKLYLNDNKINDIHRKAFLELELLEELHLDNNLLAELPAEWCNNLINLRYLGLTNNRFKYLESLSLSETLPIIDIDLINNALFNLKAKTLHDLPENVTIHLIPEKNELDRRV